METKFPPCVSIVVPVYNVEKHIAACMDSLIHQTYSNIEIIVVNDGTEDESIAVAENILKTSNKRYEIIHQNNAGVSRARNNGIKHSRGEYVITIDADDMITYDGIEKLVSSCVSNQKVQCSVGSYKVIKIDDSNNKTIKKKYVSENDTQRLLSGKEALLNYFSRKEVYIAPGMLLKRSFLQEHNITYNEECKFAEDDLYVWNVLAHVDTMAYHTADIYQYVFHKNSTMTSCTYDRFYSSYQSSIELFERVIQNSENAQSIRNVFVARHMFGVIHAAARVLNLSEFKSLLKETDFDELSKQLKYMEDKRISILIYIYRLSKTLFYILCSAA